MPSKICKEENCTGCFACMNICPKDAISCGMDEMGKTIPVIDSELCIECGLCVKTCPENSPVEKDYPLECYAAWSRDEKERKYCSSGGVAAELSRYLIEQRGVVIGTAFDENLQLTHMAAECQEQLEKFKGSKYVQSYVGMIYRQVKEYLTDGRKVLFVGTPCQIAGIRKYLNREYENLFLIDLICHGTPPMKYLREYVKQVSAGKTVTDITFRGRKNWRLTLYDENEIIYSVRNKTDYYYSAFLKGLIYRENCYQCPYAVTERCSDITIGDFWGLDRKSLQNPYGGRISVVLVNSQNGVKLWNDVKERFIFEKREVAEAVKGNAQLRKPSVCHQDRESFIKNYPANGFYEAVKTPNLKKEIGKNKIKDSLPYRAAKKVKNIMRRKQ